MGYQGWLNQSSTSLAKMKVMLTTTPDRPMCNLPVFMSRKFPALKRGRVRDQNRDFIVFTPGNIVLCSKQWLNIILHMWTWTLIHGWEELAAGSQIIKFAVISYSIFLQKLPPLLPQELLAPTMCGKFTHKTAACYARPTQRGQEWGPLSYLCVVL